MNTTLKRNVIFACLAGICFILIYLRPHPVSPAQLALVGKPLHLAFTAMDDRKVDLESLKGKVVLIDFWATWCGPCLAELPELKAAYAKLHEPGFEIIGISFDTEKSDVKRFSAREQTPWPQYFDGAGWDNAIGRTFDIHQLPTMWLVDKKGVLRELDAIGDLQSKVEALLGEK